MYRGMIILLVEDDKNHALLEMRCLQDSKVDNSIILARDGEEAIDYLFSLGKYADSAENPPPDLIVLDLRLPKTSGEEVLKKIKSSDKLRAIPVVVLTTSKNEDDMIRAYRNHANSYLVKPVGLEKFQQMMIDVGNYWLGWNKYFSDRDGSK
jgi:CheY-like chemotaxis protein